MRVNYIIEEKDDCDEFVFSVGENKFSLPIVTVFLGKEDFFSFKSRIPLSLVGEFNIEIKYNERVVVNRIARGLSNFLQDWTEKAKLPMKENVKLVEPVSNFTA